MHYIYNRSTGRANLWRNIVYFALTLLLLILLLGGHSSELLAIDAKSRDIGTVKPTCNAVTFITSLNSDDDNGDGRADNKRRIAAGVEDNLRQFIFRHNAAAKAYIAEPVFVRGGESAVGRKKRVRAYAADKQTPFEFNKEHPLPVTLYLEGTKESRNINDFGFEYDYRNADSKIICGNAAQGTVVNLSADLDVRKGKGTSFKRQNKMLITANGNASAQIAPANAARIIGWRYDGTATIHTPRMLVSRITAGQRITPANLLNGHDLRFQIQQGTLIIEAHLPVNITAPVHADAYRGWINGRPVRSGWINANRGNFSLFRRSVRYYLLDQFNERITRSAWAGRMVQIRENIGNVMSSPLPRVQNWINNSLSWTQNWINKPSGKFKDRIEATRMFKDMLLDVNAPPGRRQFAPSLLQVGGVLMNLGGRTHIWEASVNGNLPTAVTQNTFEVTVSATRPRGGGTEIRFDSSYIVNTP